MYIEPSGRVAGRDPWSYRQTGVYHRYDRANDNNTFLMLHPKRESNIQKLVESYIQLPVENQSLVGHPLNMHLIVLYSSSRHWQGYIESLAESLADIVGIALKNRESILN